MQSTQQAKAAIAPKATEFKLEARLYRKPMEGVEPLVAGFGVSAQSNGNAPTPL